VEMSNDLSEHLYEVFHTSRIYIKD